MSMPSFKDVVKVSKAEATLARDNFPQIAKIAVPQTTT